MQRRAETNTDWTDRYRQGLKLYCSGRLHEAAGYLDAPAWQYMDDAIAGLGAALPGDGLAKALMRYQRAKERFGIRSLLLGEADLTQLDQLYNGQNGGNGNGNGGNGSSRAMNHYKIKCPECSGTLVFEEGCVKCHGRGYAQC